MSGAMRESNHKKDKLSCVSYEDKLSGNYLDNFNEEGIFYCPISVHCQNTIMISWRHRG